MIYVKPDIRIYGPPLSLFGGVEIEPTLCKPSKLTEEVRKVLYELTNSLYQAYEVKSKIAAAENLVTCKISPLLAVIDERCRDYHIGTDKIAQKILRRVLAENVESALMVHDKGFYLLHILKEKFDPVGIERLLKVAEATIFYLLGDKYHITSTIDTNILKVDAEIILPPVYTI